MAEVIHAKVSVIGKHQLASFGGRVLSRCVFIQATRRTMADIAHIVGHIVDQSGLHWLH